MSISLEKRAFIVSLYEPCKRNSRKAADEYNETYYPDKICYNTILNIWKENNLKISSRGGGSCAPQKKKRNVVGCSSASPLKYFHERGKISI